jgi:hypothetical protein
MNLSSSKLFLIYYSKLTDNETSSQELETGNIIIKNMNVFSIEIYMNVLYDHFTSMKWQIKKGALILLGLFANHQKDIVQYLLPNMFLKLIDMVNDINFLDPIENAFKNYAKK